MRGSGRCHPCSSTMAMAHRSALAVESAAKPGGGSRAQTRASVNVRGGDPRVTASMVLTVGMSFRIARHVALTNRASDSARRFAE